MVRLQHQSAIRPNQRNLALPQIQGKVNSFTKKIIPTPYISGQGQEQRQISLLKSRRKRIVDRAKILPRRRDNHSLRPSSLTSRILGEDNC